MTQKSYDKESHCNVRAMDQGSSVPRKESEIREFCKKCLEKKENRYHYKNCMVKKV